MLIGVFFFFLNKANWLIFPYYFWKQCCVVLLVGLVVWPVLTGFVVLVECHNQELRLFYVGTF